MFEGFVRRISRRSSAGAIVIGLALTTCPSSTPALGQGPTDPPEPVWTAEQRGHWAFVPPVRPEIPAVEGRNWVRNPIDAFILQPMERAGVAPSPEADRATLIRRLRFDLTGLPPSAEEVAAFEVDPAPDAYERLVDRLLASQQYGERWARSWLDLARYADSDGFKNDKGRPNAWRYRDWVVKALNDDLPYDQFLALQLAGDEISPGNPDAFVATGFNRNWPFEDNNMVPGLNKQLILDDMTDTTTAVVLGLTVACARCHDHKYDAISQRDYYRFQALFAAAEAKDDYVVASAEDQAIQASVEAEHEARVDRLRRQIEAIEQPYAAEILKDKLARLPKEAREAFEADPMTRSTEQEELVKKHAKQMTVEAKKMMAALPEEARPGWQGRKKEMETLAAQAPAPLPTASGMTDLGPQAPPVRMLRKGNFANPGEEIGPGFLSVLGPTELPKPKEDSTATTGRRRALADWVTRPDNPLTARVMVNRLWLGHFGRGIVATPGDFGTQGASPTHPELLDWLATEFIARGWSQKAIHRLMATSATYRQSSKPLEKTVEADPDNLLFSRMPRRRLEGEAVRDALLAVSGQLDGRIGGPSVFPELPPGVETRGGAWPRSASPADRNRRSLYVFIKRNLKFPLFDAFDVPDTNLTCPERNVSVNAPQALMLLNSAQVLEQARALAGRVYAVTSDRADLDELVTKGYRLALGREPGPEERTRAVEFLRSQPDHLSGRGEKLTPPIPMPEGPTPAQAAAVVDFCHVLLNLNEFVFVD
jgi:Protein of unknown function (DUF1553)/Protein of unknown function (DUF1549)